MVLMYTTFFMYGFQNLRGVIEEKTSRIVEVIIASVRPTELMLGKILGIGLVGLTQYIIWSVIAMNLSLPAVAGAMASGEMGVPSIPVSMIVYFILFFLFGYFLYASIYTAIGAPFNTDQEAQQLAMIPGLFMVGCWAFYPAVLNNPNGGVATFVSLFPLTSPLMMFLRTSVAEPPFWQVLLSMAILALSTVASRGPPDGSTASASSCTARSRRSPKSSAGSATPPAKPPSPPPPSRTDLPLSPRERAGVRRRPRRPFPLTAGPHSQSS